MRLASHILPRCLSASVLLSGVTEVIQDGVTGFTVREGDVSALAERIATLLADQALRERIAAAASRGLDEFERDTMVRQQEELYEELLEEARA